MLIDINSIKINDRLRDINSDKVSEIADSIKEIGLLNPITISENHELIAGMHRLSAFKQLGFEQIEVNVVNLTGLKQELAEIDENLIRHDLHFLDRGDHLKRRKEIYEVLHPETKAGLSQALSTNKVLGVVSADSAPTTVKTFVEDSSDKVGISTRVIHEEIQISRNLSPEIKAQVKKADLSKTETLKLARLEPEKQKAVMQKAATTNDKVDNVMKEIKKEEHKAKLEQKQVEKKQELTQPIDITNKKFNVILADPPWRYNDVVPNRSIENHYPTMDLNDICEINIHADDDCILFLWATSPLLPDAIKVLTMWGFEYKTSMVWVKDRIGMGYYARGRHELLLIGIKGNPGKPEPVNRPDSVIEAPRTEHSKKPLIVYDIIEKMYPHGVYLELFSRKERSGWISWGNEINKGID